MATKPTEKKVLDMKIPSGLKLVNIDLNADDYPDVDWEGMRTVVGKVMKVRDGLKVTDPKTGEERPAAYAVIDTEVGPLKMWSSAGLSELFKQAKVGQTWVVRYKGTAQLSGGRSMKVFEAQVHG